MTPKNCAEEILSQTICAPILTQNTAFVPRSPLHPYSMRPSPRLSLALVLPLLHQTIQTKSRATRIVLKTLHSWRKQKFQAFFLNCAGNAANWMENLRGNWSFKELCADRKQARNFCAGNAFPAQTRLYSLVHIHMTRFATMTKHLRSECPVTFSRINTKDMRSFVNLATNLSHLI